MNVSGSAILVIAVIAYILIAAVLLIFNYGAHGPDTRQKRDQDWEALQEYLKKKKCP